jgi:DNA-binding IclR family transcriptional regulator
MNAITRAFEILECFRQLRRPLSLMALVRHFGYPSSSVAEILKTLSHCGYIAFDPVTRTYFPTTRLGELGNWFMTDLLPHSYPVDTLKRVREATGDTVLLGTPNELEVLYLAVIEAREPSRSITSGRRTHRPLVRSGVGIALLSLEPDEFVERIYRRTVARELIDGGDLSLEALMHQVADCRRDSYVFVTDFLNPEAALVAAPVPIGCHTQRLAIGVGGPTARIKPRLAFVAAKLCAEVQALSQGNALAPRLVS